MHAPDWTAPLEQAHRSALRYLHDLPDRRVGPVVDVAELRRTLGGPLPEHPTDPAVVVDQVAAAVEPGLVASAGGRSFGFVVGGSTPAALATDWLTSTWDQNAALSVMSPAVAVVEEVAGRWLGELLHLPATASLAFVTGAQQADVVGLAAARHEVLRRAGWDVERRGLAGAPPVRVLVGEERHATVDRAVRLLGLGTDAVVPVAADDQGRMRVDALRDRLVADGPARVPTIVCAQVGNADTGAVDPVGDLVAVAHEAGAWVHVDGAFGLWAAASPRLQSLVTGLEGADSWATDAHEWLNVPYDAGLAFCAHPSAHRAAMGVTAAYLVRPTDRLGAGAEPAREAMDWGPDASRRARGLPVYAALRALGRQGVAAMVDRTCALARRFAYGIAHHDGFEVRGDVVLDQVLVRLASEDGDEERGDARTRDLVTRLQTDGTCWVGGTTWRGRAAIRVSVSNWSTDEDDVDRSVAAFVRCAAEQRADERLEAHRRAGRLRMQGAVA